MNTIEWISTIGSIASILGLILFFLDKKELVSFKIPIKYLLILVVITFVMIGFNLLKNVNSVEIIQKEDNDHNKIEVITN